MDRISEMAERVAGSMTAASRWEVQTAVGGGWENVWTDEHEQPMVFDSRMEAKRELDDHLKSAEEAVRRGDMSEGYSRGDFRIVPVKGDFVPGDKVVLRRDVLRKHSQSVPPHAGFTTEQFSWRKRLDELEGKVGVVERVFPGSKHVNVQFDDGMIGIDGTELVRAKTASKRTAGDVPTKQEVKSMLYEPEGEYFMEKKPDGLYLSLYSIRDAHRIFSTRFDSRFDREEVGLGRAGVTTYRITRKAVVASSDWMTAAEVGEICKACEGKMAAAGIKRVRRSYFEAALREAKAASERG